MLEGRYYSFSLPKSPADSEVLGMTIGINQRQRLKVVVRLTLGLLPMVNRHLSSLCRSPAHEPVVSRLRKIRKLPVDHQLE
jgi:hypothetical protein